MYEKKYVDCLGHKGTILPRYNGDWVYYDGPDVRHTDPGCHSESVSRYGRDAITSMLESFAKAADIINQLSDKL